MQIGFIGLGNMGMAMAKPLVKKGFPLIVFDLNPEAMTEMAKLGAQTAASCREVAQKSHVIISVVRDSAQNNQVLFGKDGVWEGISKDKIIIIASTVSPKYVQQLAQKAKEIGVHVIDMGVSDPSGPLHYQEACLTLMIGGEEEPVARCRPLFAAMGEHIFHLGPVGTGMAYKLVNNLSAIGNAAITRECINLGLKAGLDLDKMLEVMSVSSGGTCLQQIEVYMKKHGLKRPASKASGDTKLTNKDKKLALELAASVGAQTPIADFLSTLDLSVYDAYLTAKAQD